MWSSRCILLCEKFDSVFCDQHLPAAALQYELDLCKEDLANCKADLESARKFHHTLASHHDAFLSVPAGSFLDSGYAVADASAHHHGEPEGDDLNLSLHESGTRVAVEVNETEAPSDTATACPGPRDSEVSSPSGAAQVGEGGVSGIRVMQNMEPSVVPTQSLPSGNEGVSSSLQVFARHSIQTRLYCNAVIPTLRFAFGIRSERTRH